MDDNKIIKIAAVGFIGLVVAPVVVGTVINLVGVTAVGVGNVVNRIQYNRNIKKGLKNGSIVDIDGQFYNVERTNEEA